MSAPVSFDIFYWQIVPWRRLAEDARYVDALPVRTLWLGDTYAMPAKWGGPVLESWTTLAALAVCTTRVRLGTAVSDVPLRHPAMLAKAAATVDVISDGRVAIGLGAGDNFAEERQYLGLLDLPAGKRIDRLTEAVEIIDGLFTKQPFTLNGEYYKVDSAPLVPTPVQQPRPPLTISAQGKRALKLAAQRAETCMTAAWGSSGEESLAGVVERNQLLDQYCGELGRDPATLERACFIGWSDFDTPFASREAFQDVVGHYRDAGVNRFVLSLGAEDTPEPYAKWVQNGQWMTREKIDAYVAEEMRSLLMD